MFSCVGTLMFAQIEPSTPPSLVLNPTETAHGSIYQCTANQHR